MRLNRFVTLILSMALFFLGSLGVSAQDRPTEIFSLAMSPIGIQYATSSFTGELKIWDKNSQTTVLSLPKPVGSSDNYYGAITWRPNGQWLASGDLLGNIYIWNISDPQYAIGQLIRMVPTDLGIITSMDWHQDGVQLAVVSRTKDTGFDPTIVILDATTGTILGEQRAGDLNSVDWLADTNFFVIAGVNDGVMKISLPLPKPISENLSIYTFPQDDPPSRVVAWNPSYTQLAIGRNYDGIINIVDTNGQTLRLIQAHPANIFALAWSPDGSKIASQGNGGQLKIWDVQSGELISSRQLSRLGVLNSLAWTLDGTQILFADTGLTPILALASDLSIEVTPTPQNPCGRLAFMPSEATFHNLHRQRTDDGNG